MAGSKETPRQRMIGMMYLVLTALLALNVSKEIVNAFVRLNDKIEDSNRILQAKIEQDYDEFNRLMMVKETKNITASWNQKAQEIRGLAEKEIQYILNETNALLKETEGQSSNWLYKDSKTGRTNLKSLMDVESKDDYDAATRIFVGGNPADPIERGKQLRNHLQQLRDKMCNLVGTYEVQNKSYKFNAADVKGFDPRNAKTFVQLKNALKKANPSDTSVITQIYKTLSYPEKLKEFEETTSWQGAMFDHAPVVAAAAILTSLRSDIKNAEALAVDFLLGKVNTPPFNFNTIEPVAFAPKGYLNVGDTMPLKVMIAAYDSNSVAPIKYSENAEMKDASELTGPITIKASSPGIKTIYGNIAIKQRGEIVWKPWNFTYEVGQPTASIAATDLNILYAGSFENKISASASGYSPEEISLTGGGLDIKKKGTGYIVKVPYNLVGRAVKLNVVAKGKNVGSTEFRVRKTPRPLTYLGVIPSTESYISKSQLNTAVNAGVRLSYDENAPITGVTFKVNSFKVEFSANGAQGGFSCPNGTMTQDQKNKILQLRTGATLTVREIQGTGPSGAEKGSAISLTIR